MDHPDAQVVTDFREILEDDQIQLVTSAAIPDLRCGIGLQVLDGAAGSGLEADFSITNFSRSEQLEEALTVSVTAKVTYAGTAPTWI